jgi:hypothetical protein
MMRFSHRQGFYGLGRYGNILCLWIALLTEGMAQLSSSQPLAIIHIDQQKKELFEEDLRRFIRLKYHADLQKNDQNLPLKIDVKQELEALIQLELLNGYAQKIGLDQSTALKYRLKQLSISYFLKNDFEQGLVAGRLPQKYVDQAYEQNKIHFNHDELRGAVHLLFLVYDQSFEKAKPHLKNEAKANAEAFYQKLMLRQQQKIISLDEFKALAQETQNELLLKRQQKPSEAQIEARFEPLGYFTKNSPFVKPFIDAVFALPKAPIISPIFETSFGYHIVYLNEIIPPFYTPPDIVDREIRAKITDEVRRIELNAMIEKLLRHYQPEVALVP